MRLILKQFFGAVYFAGTRIIQTGTTLFKGHLFCPIENIITPWHARLVEGRCWGKNNLCVEEEDLEYGGKNGGSGYMNHDIGEGCIIIQVIQT